MTTERRFAAPGARLAAGAELALGADAARHARVLRLSPGDSIRLFDGAGLEAEGEIVSIDDHTILVRVAALRERVVPACRVVLIQCVPKGAKLEDLVRAVTEVGVHAIHLALSAHAVSRPDEARGERRALRLSRIAEEAARQSERADVPALSAPLPLLEVARRAPRGAARLQLSPRAERRWDAVLSATPAEVWLVVGPEGGLSAEEERALESLGYARARIAVGVLRVETAAPVAIALLVDHLARRS